MPIIDGIEVLNRSKKNKPHLPFIMLTGHGNINTAVEAMKIGAFDFISKPPDLNRLITSVRNAIENNKLKSENKKLKKRFDKSYKIIGNSKSIIAVKEMISKVANTDARVQYDEVMVKVTKMSSYFFAYNSGHKVIRPFCSI